MKVKLIENTIKEEFYNISGRILKLPDIEKIYMPLFKKIRSKKNDNDRRITRFWKIIIV